MIEIRFNDLVYVIIAIVCLINSKFISDLKYPRFVRIISWIIVMASIVLLIMGFTGRISSEVFLTIGKQK